MQVSCEPASAIGHLLLARLFLAKGNSEGALETFEQLDRTIQGHLISPDVMSDIQGFRVRLSLAQGNESVASKWAEHLASNPPLDFRHERDQITRARVLIAQGNAADAHGVLERLKGAAECASRTGRQIEIELLDALALNMLEEGSQALEELEHSLALAEPEGYCRLFLDEGEQAQSLISEWRRQHANAAPRLRDYSDQLLASFPPSAADHSEPQGDVAQPDLDNAGDIHPNCKRVGRHL